MNELTSVFLLLTVPLAPLLMAIPGLRRNLPWPVHWALLPAGVLLLIPGRVSVELPWMLLGQSGLAFDALSRWWLAMSVVLWAVAAAFLDSPANRQIGSSPRTTWLLLSLTGQMGLVLAPDLVGFFAFSSLMGYAFIGFLTVNGDANSRYAAKVYLVLLVIADIALFEALLVFATISLDLSFAGLAESIALSSAAGFAMLLTVAGFSLRAGLWPSHNWLLAAGGSAVPALGLLLWGGPVTAGLLGILRWLPLGVIRAAELGIPMLLLGLVAVLYALWFGLTRASPGQRTACVIIALTGALMAIIGGGLAYPGFWQHYGKLVPAVIAGGGFVLTLSCLGMMVRQREQKFSVAAGVSETNLMFRFEGWLEARAYQLRHAGQDNLPRLLSAARGRLFSIWHLSEWKNRLDSGEHILRRWSIAIVLFLLLATLTTLAGILSDSG